MACPTCDHTLESIAVPSGKLYWCPRCGTLREVGAGGFTRDTTPKLVERCRQFGPKLGPEYLSQCGHLAAFWRTLGIAESIHPPAERK